jgi:Protein of unknown function (DUF664)
MEPKDFRSDPPYDADERTMLEAYLDYHRGTLLWKASALTGEQLVTASVEPSKLTMLGLILHLALNERWWFRQQAAQLDLPDTYDLSENPDAELLVLDPDRAEEDLAIYRREVEAAREAVRDLPLDHTFPELRRKNRLSLRWVYLHMIEEYARHNCHADLIRERIDGLTGE